MFNRYYFVSAMRYKNGEHVGWNYSTLHCPFWKTPEDVIAFWQKDAENEDPGCEFHVTTFNRV